MKCPSHKKHVVDVTTAGMNVIKHEERLLVNTPDRESSAGLKFCGIHCTWIFMIYMYLYTILRIKDS